MEMMLWFYLLFAVHTSHTFADVRVSYHPRIVRQASYPNKRQSPCTTPTHKTGVCIALESCPSLYQLLLTNGQNPPSANFLRESQCGTLTQNGMPVVCCPDAISDPTRKSTSKPPVTKKPVTKKPATKKPVTSKPTTRRPTTSKPTTRRPVTSKPTTRRSVTSKPTTRGPITQGPTPSTAGNYGECGKTVRSDSRIVGGKNASLGDWPWMVALGYSSANSRELDFKCGATLISNKWVLTAAHCVEDIGNVQLTTARLGDLDLNPSVDDKATPVDAIISEIIPHPGHTTNPITNDIALLRLKNTVQFSKYIRPACVLSGSEYRSDTFYDRKRPFIIGWGAVEWRGATSSLLQETTLSIVNLTSCAETYATQRSAKIDERVLCAGEKGRDTCQGDSGGPLIFPIRDKNGKDTFYLGGVVSFGVRCADLVFPGVYTRVAAFSDWISQTTGLALNP